MSLSVKHLNADTSFLLTFSPPFANEKPSQSVPGSCTILIDPWFTGVSTVFHASFAKSEHVIPAAYKSLEELPEPDLVLISQDKPDHCHRETLTQLPADTGAIIIGTNAAAKKIKGWKHFDFGSVMSLKTYDPKKKDTLFRYEIPSFSPNGSPGELTLALIAPRFDITGVHNAIGITYRPPSSVLTQTSQSASFRKLPSLPLSAVTTSNGRRLSNPTPISTTVRPSPLGEFREKTISVIYSPHGVDYGTLIKPYAEAHLVNEAALPITTLIHSFDRCYNPWYLGGNVCAGMPGGMQIAYGLCPRVWISAHDEDKLKSGVSVRQLKIEKNSAQNIKEKMRSIDSGIGGMEETKKVRFETVNDGEFIALLSGQEYVYHGDID